MRHTFIDNLIQKAKKNKNIYLVTADLGYRAFENFKKKFPQRFINVGVAENNMVGVASGLALSGKKVFIYSILPFLVFRSLEHIRNNICHNNLNVSIVGVGGGFSYGPQGISHNTFEDISIMQSLPNINIFNPGSSFETKLAMDLIFKNNSPSFIRLGKSPEIDFYNKNITLKIGNGLVLSKGKDISIFTTGNILQNVFNAVEEIKKLGFSVNLISMPILKPINYNFLLKFFNSKKILTIEENSPPAPLNNIISKIIISRQIKNTKFKSIMLKDKVHNLIGSQEYLRDINNLSSKKIFKQIIKYLNE